MCLGLDTRSVLFKFTGRANYALHHASSPSTILRPLNPTLFRTQAEDRIQAEAPTLNNKRRGQLYPTLNSE